MSLLDRVARAFAEAVAAQNWEKTERWLALAVAIEAEVAGRRGTH